jgi:protein tyrosine phosphatase (PTP) superfamily phosphohydrolase (DUF442 family)
MINYRRINDLITTSGQPTEAHLAALKADGVTQVVNLGPHDNKGALPDEAASLAALDLPYTYIPVDFDAPTDDDFAQFCDAMETFKGQKIHVHCIYNARVSAFFYRYATAGKGGDPARQFEQMDGIWRPGGVWATFIGNDTDVGEVNRYKGDAY